MRYSEDQNCGRLELRDRPGKDLAVIGGKTRLPELVAGVEERKEEVVITKNGRPVAVLINVQEYACLKETLDVLSDPDLMDQIAKGRTFYKSGKKGLSFEDVFGEPLILPKERRTA